MSTVEEKLFTESELMALGPDARVEIVQGEMIEMPPVGMLHHLVAGNIYRALYSFVEHHESGYVFRMACCACWISRAKVFAARSCQTCALSSGSASRAATTCPARSPGHPTSPSR
jgi:Uma2 family endonuclease